jgi:hypothetical protein
MAVVSVVSEADGAVVPARRRLNIVLCDLSHIVGQWRPAAGKAG